MRNARTVGLFALAVAVCASGPSVVSAQGSSKGWLNSSTGCRLWHTVGQGRWQLVNRDDFNKSRWGRKDLPLEWKGRCIGNKAHGPGRIFTAAGSPGQRFGQRILYKGIPVGVSSARQSLSARCFGLYERIKLDVEPAKAGFGGSRYLISYWPHGTAPEGISFVLVVRNIADRRTCLSQPYQIVGLVGRRFPRRTLEQTDVLSKLLDQATQQAARFLSAIHPGLPERIGQADAYLIDAERLKNHFQSYSSRASFLERRRGRIVNHYLNQVTRERSLRMRREAEQKRLEERRRQQALEREAEKKREAAKRAALLDRRKKSRERFRSINGRLGIQVWPGPRAMEANPFIYEGRILGFVATLVRIQSRDAGWFRVTSLRGRSSTVVMIKGVDARRILPGGYQIVAVKFDKLVGRQLFLDLKGIHYCRTSGCQDLVFWRR